MIAKVRSATFIDTLQFQLESPSEQSFKAVLFDEKGSICSEFESGSLAQEQLTWKGLNDLPYGIYTLELTQGEDLVRMRLVKRI